MNGNNKPLEPLHIKGGPQLQNFSHSNSLCTRATKAIINHALIGEYRLRFFPNKEFSCPCGQYPIESRRHILHDCKRFNEYWNLHRNSIIHFVMFLKCNHNAFTFSNDITQFAMGLSHSQQLYFPSFSLYLFSFFLLSFSFSFSSLHVVSFFLYVVTKQLLQSALTLCVINC